MSNVLRKWLFRLLLAASCSGLLFWFFHVPYDNTAVLRAIPSNAAYIGVHDNVAARWRDISVNPLVRTLACSAGI